jgi:hypothetical protein
MSSSLFVLGARAQVRPAALLTTMSSRPICLATSFCQLTHFAGAGLIGVEGAGLYALGLQFIHDSFGLVGRGDAADGDIGVLLQFEERLALRARDRSGARGAAAATLTLFGRHHGLPRLSICGTGDPVDDPNDLGSRVHRLELARHQRCA